MAHALATGTRRASTRRHERQRPTPLRLTRRGRFVLIILPLSLAMVGLLALWAALMAPAHAEAEMLAGPGEAVAVTVQPGDSLWTIAAEHAPGQDARVTIGQIQELNDLTGSRVVAGERLLVPVLD
ncbi:LysM peptidoglycan-binding domain-containing protein [Sinomonas halotolerans]|uniref:LysM peptidoglycan-binding domain-containing protein n=1 Tax=Sinomonas halotolerans TaxID=1644133 RepID=A0ABU9WVJ5_9MICC